MHSDLQILVGEDGDQLDTWGPDKSIVELSFQVRTADGLGATSGDFSKRIKLPATGRNLELLGFPNDPGSFKTYSRQLVDVRIMSGGCLVLAGKGRASLFEGVMGNEETVELLVLGNNLVWVQDMAETSMRDTTDMGEFRLTQANVEDSWDAANDYDTNSGIRMFPVNYGAWSFTDHIIVSDLRPHLSVRLLLETMFAQHGFTIVGSWISSAYVDKLYRVFVDNGEYRQPEGFDHTWSVLATRSTAQSLTDASSGFLTKRVEYNFTTAGTDPSGQYDETTDFEWTCGRAQEVRWDARAQLNIPSGGAADVYFELWHEDGDTAVQTMLGQHIQSVTSGTYDFVVLTDYLEMDEGDIVWAQFILPGPIGAGVEIVASSDTKLQSFLTLKIVEGSRIEPTNYLKDDKSQLWYLQQIGKLFNLVFDTDPVRRQVRIEPWVDFYGDDADADDRTDRVDRSKSTVAQFRDLNLNRFQLFRYSKDENDAKVAFLEGQIDNDLPLHALEEDLGEVYQYKQSEVKPELAPTAIRQETFGTIINSGTAHAPQLWKELPDGDYPAPTYDFLERIVTYQGQDTSVNWNAFESGNAVTGWPLAYPVNYFASSDEDESLSWEDITLDSTAKLPGLFSRYYYEQIQQIVKGRRLTVPMIWTQSDIETLDKRRLIILNNEYGRQSYRLVQIQDWRPNEPGAYATVLDQVVKVEAEPKVRPGYQGNSPFEGLLTGDDEPELIRDLTVPTLLPSATVDLDDGEGPSIPGGGASYSERMAGSGAPSFKTPGGENYARRGRGALAVGEGGWAVARGAISAGTYPAKDAEALLNIGSGDSTTRQSALRLTKAGQQSGATTAGGPYVILDVDGNPMNGVRVLRYEIDYTDIAGLGGTAGQLDLGSLFDGDVLVFLKLKVATAFSGGTISAATGTVIWDAQDSSEEFAQVDLTTASGDTGGSFEMAPTQSKLPNQTEEATLQFDVTLVGDQLSALTAGSCTVWVGVANLV